MAVGFPLAEAPRDKEVATGMVRTIVPVPVVMALRLWRGAGVFTAEVWKEKEKHRVSRRKRDPRWLGLSLPQKPEVFRGQSFHTLFWCPQGQ